jgi:uncharacterized protein
MNDKILKILEKREFNCQKCSACCRHEPGAVFLRKEDVELITNFLYIPEEDLLKKYCRGLLKGEKNIVALKEKANYDCIFWDKKCTIYEARPLQCRTFPYWPFLVESQKDWNEECYRCPGINVKGDITIEERYKFYESEKYSEYMEMPK